MSATRHRSHRAVALARRAIHYAIPSGTLSRRQKERHVVSRWSVGKRQQPATAPHSRRSTANSGRKR